MDRGWMGWGREAAGQGVRHTILPPGCPAKRLSRAWRVDRGDEGPSAARLAWSGAMPEAMYRRKLAWPHSPPWGRGRGALSQVKDGHTHRR